VKRATSFVVLSAPVVVLLSPAPAAGQALQTPWGDPDLQGIWSNPVVTPLERPEGFGTREFLTSEEIAAAGQQLVEQSQQPGRGSGAGASLIRSRVRR